MCYELGLAQVEASKSMETRGRHKIVIIHVRYHDFNVHSEHMQTTATCLHSNAVYIVRLWSMVPY